MRLNGFLASTLVSIAAAATADQQPSEAYILRSKLPAADDAASLPHELAEAVLLQRLSTPDRSYPLGSLPESVKPDHALAMISQLGKPSLPLFQQTERVQPHQLIIEFSGVTTDIYKTIKAAIPRVPLAFTSDQVVYLRAPANTKKCAFGPSISTSRTECWDGTTQYLRYDVTKDSNVIKQLAINLAHIKSAALDGRMETIFLINGPDSAHARRHEEKPMTEAAYTFDPANPGSTGVSIVGVDSPAPVEGISFAAPTGVIPPCFKSEEACNKGTNNCTGHGKCAPKYSGESACFHCKCLHTRETNSAGTESLYRWGGSACQKIDVSTPFWLFAGVGIALAVTIGFCITLLYNVGEEKLPGVIGAGVARGSK
ncbi:uncharacterized protein B0I36DRAFT_381478 [Microdochium trichocladiopsis]|uniref:Vacuolar sorting protein Vps3844 C-terminal domain-containing protein n=1 Tax=Microdochium trichocladiopsis TaxID=1682393 RepID=A0A9P8YA15_9PEZI|nr:uncharacterized protein B0I36DRAFT_381478 [Microdochium trichocladiopsis]KAH7034566.1 hypothetical protein B0I36DRAFT_381478 [Microdochium trichocladiopsis]